MFNLFILQNSKTFITFKKRICEVNKYICQILETRQIQATLKFTDKN